MARLAANPVPPAESVRLREVFASPMRLLTAGQLDERVGEVLLLHSERPQMLHRLLFEGYELRETHGLFGRGTYVCEVSPPSYSAIVHCDT